MLHHQNAESRTLSERERERKQNKREREREREREFAFLRQHFERSNPAVGRRPRSARPPPSHAEHPPIRPSRTSPATKNPHPRARNQLPHFFYATQRPAHLQQQ